LVTASAVFSSPILYFEGLLTNQGATTGDSKVFLEGTHDVHISINSGASLSSRSVSNTTGTALWSESFPYFFVKGQIYAELGRRTPIPDEILGEPELSFVISVDGVSGEVSVPILHVPLAARADVAGRALSVRSTDITGNISSSVMSGVYSGITGVGPLAITLNIVNDLKVGNSLFVDSKLNRVGVGTTTPTVPLDVAGSVRIQSGNLIFPDGTTMNTAAQDIKVAKGITSGSDINLEGQGKLGVKLATVERLTLTSDGLMGVGVTNPSQELDVNGGIRVRPTNRKAAGTIRYQDGHFEGYNGTQWVLLDTSTESDGFWDYDSNTQFTTFVRPDSKIGIGVALPLYPLHVAGTVKADSFVGVFEGDGSRITSLNTNALVGEIGFSRGGTGVTAASANSLFYYNATANALAGLVLKPGQLLSIGSNGVPTGAVLERGMGILITTADSRVIISHGGTSQQSSFVLADGNVIQSVQLDDNGHVIGLSSTNLDDR
jgi:hypothetical protein